VFAAVQKVELVGGETWWTHNGGSLVVAVAAIFAAGLAAYVAIKTHQGQLNHDRRERNRGHIREVLDAAASAAGSARQALIRYTSAIGVVERALKAREKPSKFSETNATDQQMAALDSVQAMHTELTRLEIRLGREHEVSNAYRDALVALNEVMRNDRVPSSPDDLDEDAREARIKAINRAFHEYQQVSYAWFNE
jgi:hypothetical protein